MATMYGIILTRNHDLYSNKAFINAQKSQLLELEVISFLDVQLDEDSVFYKGSILNPDFVISRVGLLDSDFGLDVYTSLMNCSIGLNSIESIKKCKNKVKTLVALKRDGLPIPESHFIFDPLDIAPLASNLPESIVIKPFNGMKGWGVEQKVLPNDLESIIDKVDEYGGLIIQEFLPSNNMDFRYFVLGNEVIASMGRKNENDFRSNINCGGIAINIPQDRDREELAIKATKAVGANFAAVDIISSNGKDFILEVNDCPGFESINSLGKFNICDRIVSYMETKSRA